MSELLLIICIILLVIVLIRSEILIKKADVLIEAADEIISLNTKELTGETWRFGEERDEEWFGDEDEE